MPKVTRIVEAIQPGQALSAAPGPGRMRIQLISPGEGSGGYYSAEMLQQAAADKVFGEGCQMFMDHPGATESYDRPERSVRDLAAVLLEDANWDAELQALVAEAKVYKPFAETLAEMKDDIGVSIRAYAETSARKPGESPNIDRITEAISVDFVTRAGRGGKILEVLESARAPQITARAVEAGVAEATANDTRAALSQALRDAYGGEHVWIYLLDFDESTAWFEHETPDASALYAQTYTISAELAVALDGEPIEVRRQTTYVPVAPAGSEETTESEEDTMPQIEEARLRQLEEASGRVPALEAERDQAQQERDAALRSVAESNARETGIAIVDRLLGESELDQRSQRVIRAGVRPTLNESGQFDQAAFETAVREAITAETTAVAAEAEAGGAGKVAGVGGSKDGGGEGITEAELDKKSAAAFGRAQKGA